MRHHTYERVWVFWEATPLCVCVCLCMCQMNEPSRSYESVHMTDSSHDCFTCATCATCNRTHPYTRHNFFVCVTWGIYICDMTHSHAFRNIGVDESCRTCEAVMSHIWMRRRTYEWVWVFSGATKNMCDITHLYKCDSQIWVFHVTHINESCRTYAWVVSHMWMSHVEHMNEARYTHEWVLWHTSMSHVTRVNGECHAYEFVVTYTWMSPVAHKNESCHTCEWVGCVPPALLLLLCMPKNHSHV